MVLLHPEYGWLLLLLLPLGAALFWLQRHSYLFIQDWITPGSYHLPAWWLKPAVQSLGLLLVAFALMAPAWPEDKQPQRTLERDIYFLMDLSASMGSDDVAPSRLEAARRVLLQSIPALTGENLGLIGFTSFAYTQCPLTKDTAMFRTFVELLQPEQFAATGTSWRRAMLLARTRLDSLSRAQRTGHSRILVLLTDGQTEEPPLQSVINRLADSDITLIPVGIGTRKGAAVPNPVPGSTRYMQHPRTGKVAFSSLGEQHLQELAEGFGTEALLLPDVQGGLQGLSQRLVAAIRAQPAAFGSYALSKEPISFYPHPLALGLLLLLASIFIRPYHKPYARALAA